MDFKLDLIKKTNYLKYSMIFLSVGYPTAYFLGYLNEFTNKEFEVTILLIFMIVLFIALLPTAVTSLKYKKVGDIILTDEAIKINTNFYEISVIEKLEVKIGGYEDNQNKISTGTDNFFYIYVKGNIIKARFFLLMEYHLFVINDIVNKWEKKYPETEIICNTKKGPQQRALKDILRSFFTSSKE